jgi:hypothetical protein
MTRHVEETSKDLYEYTGECRVIRNQISNLIFKLQEAMNPIDEEFSDAQNTLARDKYPTRIEEFKDDSDCEYFNMLTPELLDALDIIARMRSNAQAA